MIGRKNGLFANTPKGAHSSALIYSLVETAKENDLNPLTYLTYLFERLPNINLKDPIAVDALLPWSDVVQSRCRVPEKPVPPASLASLIPMISPSANRRKVANVGRLRI